MYLTISCKEPIRDHMIPASRALRKFTGMGLSDTEKVISALNTNEVTLHVTSALLDPYTELNTLGECGITATLFTANDDVICGVPGKEMEHQKTYLSLACSSPIQNRAAVVKVLQLLTARRMSDCLDIVNDLHNTPGVMRAFCNMEAREQFSKELAEYGVMAVFQETDQFQTTRMVHTKEMIDLLKQVLAISEKEQQYARASRLALELSRLTMELKYPGQFKE